MLTTLTNRAFNAPLWMHAIATLASFGAFQGTRIFLDKLYAASQHPVDFATGQLGFDGAKTLGYYDAMREGGTFGIYVQTKLFDFAFIASVIVFGICFGTLLARMGQARSLTRKLGLAAAGFAVAGGLLDASENLMSFILMQFDTVIPQVLAYIYSSFAALKFISLTLAMALALATVITGVISSGLGMLRRPTAA